MKKNDFSEGGRGKCINMSELLVKSFFKKHGIREIKHFEKLDEENLKDILDIFNGKVIESKDGFYEYCMGTYLFYEKKDLENAKKYYLNSAEKGNMYGITKYASIMEEEGNLEVSKTYYLKAIELGDPIAMFNYAVVIEEEKNIEGSDLKSSEAKKYYLKAIELGDTDSMINYANIFYEKKDFKTAKKYYLMCLEKIQDKDAMYNYGMILEKEKNIEEAKKYYLMAIENGDLKAVKKYRKLTHEVDKNEAVKYYYKCFEKTKDISILERIKFLLNTNEMAESIGQILSQFDELKEKVDHLSNFREAVKDMGPMNALVLGYI